MIMENLKKILIFTQTSIYFICEHNILETNKQTLLLNFFCHSFILRKCIVSFSFFYNVFSKKWFLIKQLKQQNIFK